MAKINPRKIKGRWDEGYALDIHVISSIPIGQFSSGRTEFETTRSEVGELLFRLKNRNDRNGVPDLATTAAQFILAKQWQVDAIVPIPPSRSRIIQPVFEVARSLGEQLHIPVFEDGVSKVKATTQLKDIPFAERPSLLSDAFTADVKTLSGKRILLLDDLYETGSSMKAVTDKLIDQAKVQAIFALALTITKAGAQL